MADVVDDDGRRVKRFKYKSHKDTVKDVHLPSSLAKRDLDDEAQFYSSIQHWRQLNLSPGFIKFSNDVDGISASIPLLVHNWRQVVDLWLTALDGSDDEALRALLDLLEKLAHDLRMTLSPAYTQILSRLLKFLPRSLSAPALSALLEALSAIFKYVLIPDLELFEKTWDLLCGTLEKCDAEVQRAMAEVWGSVLRRIKSGSRDHCVGIMIPKFEGAENTIAWMFVFACKSVSQTLHTATPSLIAPFFSYHLSSPSPTVSYTILRRVLTALAHHVKSCEQFSPLADLLVDRSIQILQNTNESEETRRRALDIIAVPLSVRQGSRMSQEHVTRLLSVFPSLPLTLNISSSLLNFSTSSIIACKTWTSAPVRTALAHAWTVPEFAVKLMGCLGQIGWGGWRGISLPGLVRATSTTLASKDDRRAMLGLLAWLWGEGKLNEGDVDIVWRKNVGEWVDSRLATWLLQGGNLSELADLLSLSGLLSPGRASSHLLSIVSNAFQLPPSSQRSEILSKSIGALARRPSTEWVSKIDLGAWCEQIVSSQPNEGLGEVLNTLVELLEASGGQAPIADFTVFYPALQTRLLSHSHLERLGALRLLTCDLVMPPPSSRARDVVRRCLQGEEIPLSVQGVRERLLHISRVGRTIVDGDTIGAEIGVRWLTAQLKVNLRPLWGPTCSELAQLAGRFGDVVWRLVFEELRAVSDVSEGGSSEQVGEGEGEDNGDDEDPWEDERTWRDPSAHKVRSTVILWLYGQRSHFQDPEKRERVDLQSYEAQLLAVLGECATLAEKHNRDLVPFFLSLSGSSHSKSNLSRQKLVPWLTLFSKFVNPKALYASDMLYNFYTAHLAHPDRLLQSVSLSCVLTYKSAHLLAYENTLRALLDDTRWRDELVGLDLSSISPPQARTEIAGVLIRLLFGLMLEKRGRSRGGDRRAAVLGAYAGCTDTELGLLVELMLRPIWGDKTSTLSSCIDLQNDYVLNSIPVSVSEKRQIGYLTLLGEVMRNLGPRLIQYWPALLGATIDLTAHAQAKIDNANTHAERENDDQDADEEVEEVGDLEVVPSAKTTRSVRSLGVKRLADFFKCPVSFDFTVYLATSFRAFISSRLASLDKENTQSPSALLELFYSWTTRRDYVCFLVSLDAHTLPMIYECLVAPNVKPAVVLRIFDLVDRVLAFSKEDEEISETVVKPHVSRLLTNLAILVERTKGTVAVSTPLAQRQISILSEVSRHLTNETQASTLLELFSPLLRKPSKFVSEKVKVDLLKILGDILPLITKLSDSTASIHDKTYELLSQLFQSLRGRPARVALVAAFRQFVSVGKSYPRLADLMESLNAYSTKRMDEPDFDRRLEAFTSLNEELYNALSAQEWLPILYNMLNFIQDPLELAVRNNASYALRRFVDLAVASPSEYESTLTRILWSGLKNGLRTKNEMARAEILGVIAYAIPKCDTVSSLKEMRILLAGGDEEANFFNNIYHVQIHRRTRALRRLADHCEEGHLRSNTLAEIFVPLVGNFITSTALLDHHLVNEAITTTGRMAKCLAWGSYYTLVQKYLKLSRDRDESERVYVRTLVAILENFHFPMEEAVPVIDDVVDEENADGQIEEDSVPHLTPALSKPNDIQRISDAVNMRLLPNLLNHLEKRDVTEDSMRIPISIGIVKVAQHLPEITREPQITRLLTILSQILRSKSSETRDLVRETLCRIVVTLGPSYLSLTLRELRGALLRGPQLHVLAYVTHALLVHVTADEHTKTFHTLDSCVDDVAHVSAEVIFGESGKDIQSEDFKTKMREVRAAPSKGLDSFTILSKFVTPSKISGILHPLRSILQQTETLKVMQQVEEVFRRIAGGLNSNVHLIPSELLVLCHTLISQNARFLQQAPSSRTRKGKPKGNAIVQTKRDLVPEVDHYANNSFRFVVFGLDLFQTAFRRSRFDFKDPNIIARLEPMVSVIGNTLYSNNLSVLISSLKASSAIVKCPLKSLDKFIPVFVRQIIDIVKQTGSTESEVVQAAFKSLATILRDCPSAQAKEKDLVYILELLSPDLEDTNRQAAVFTMLRAIIARKFVVPEIYDLMDKVSEITVTSQSSHVQELCRGVLLQFLLDYPQGKGRLRNQMTFLAKNLSYVYESGRKSVLELLNAVVSKFQVELVREYADLLFVALVMVLANDDSTKCREMASELVKNLFSRLDEEHQKIVTSHLHTWASQYSQPQLVRVSSQVYGLIIDVLQQDSLSYIPIIMEDISSAMERSSQQLTLAESSDGMEVDLEWQTSYHALIVLSKSLRTFPSLITEPGKAYWTHVVSHLLFPHAWVRTASCRLIGTLYNTVPIAEPREDSSSDSPLSRAGMEDVANKLCLQLKSDHLDAPLGLQIVKNLFYIGKCFCEISTTDELKVVDESDEEEDEDDIEEEGGESKRNDPLPWLFSKLSYQARSAHIARRNRSSSAANWSQQPLSVLRWFAAMASHMDASKLENFLVHILSPVYRITEDDTIRDAHMEELKTLAIELQDLVQSKVGTTKFATVYNQIRQSVLGVRRERKAARATQVATNPAAAAKRKSHRNVIKKDSRKRKNQAFVERKGKTKRRRED